MFGLFALKKKGKFAILELGPVSRITRGGYYGVIWDGGDPPYDRSYPKEGALAFLGSCRMPTLG